MLFLRSNLVFVLLAAGLTFAHPAPYYTARQSPCTSICQDKPICIQVIGLAAQQCACSSEGAQMQVNCYSCEAQNGLALADAQQLLQNFLSGCSASGFPLSGYSLSVMASPTVAPTSPSTTPDAIKSIAMTTTSSIASYNASDASSTFTLPTATSTSTSTTTSASTYLPPSTPSIVPLSDPNATSTSDPPMDSAAVAGIVTAAILLFLITLGGMWLRFKIKKRRWQISTDVVDERFRASPFLQGRPLQQDSPADEKKALGEGRRRSHGLDLDDIATRVMRMLVVHNHDEAGTPPPLYDGAKG